MSKTDELLMFVSKNRFVDVTDDDPNDPAPIFAAIWYSGEHPNGKADLMPADSVQCEKCKKHYNKRGIGSHRVGKRCKVDSALRRHAEQGRVPVLDEEAQGYIRMVRFESVNDFGHYQEFREPKIVMGRVTDPGQQAEAKIAPYVAEDIYRFLVAVVKHRTRLDTNFASESKWASEAPSVLTREEKLAILMAGKTDPMFRSAFIALDALQVQGDDETDEQTERRARAAYLDLLQTWKR